ncbi:MAG: hypothetical protein LW636_00880 [Planctomycetaceae bacterium]|jgi:hypothetical protein|nr:hypothetical protein [Planctomycetaceae bacterium]
MRFSRIAASLSSLVFAAAASAQQVEPPPEPTFVPSTSPVVGYLIMAVLFGAIVAISLMPSKRSNTDL